MGQPRVVASWVFRGDRGLVGAWVGGLSAHERRDEMDSSGQRSWDGTCGRAVGRGELVERGTTVVLVSMEVRAQRSEIFI